MLFTVLLASNFIVMSDRSQFWDADKISDKTETIEKGIEKEVNYKEFAGKRILLLIHGFNDTAKEALESYREINEQIGSFRLYDTVIGYLWPWYHSGTEYFSAEKNAKALAARMRLHLSLLSTFAAKVDLIGHSMGNRLVLEALEEAVQGKKLIHNYYSLAPAVNDDSIEQGHPYFHSVEQCEIMFVFHSNQDDVLKFLYLIAEQDRALGSEGDGEPKYMPKNVQFIDCTEFVTSHSGYFTVPSFYEFIRASQRNHSSASPNVKLLVDGSIIPIEGTTPLNI